MQLRAKYHSKHLVTDGKRYRRVGYSSRKKFQLSLGPCAAVRLFV